MKNYIADRSDKQNSLGAAADMCKSEHTCTSRKNVTAKHIKTVGKATEAIEADKLKQALYNRALGYETQEIIEEFCSDGCELSLLKKRLQPKRFCPILRRLNCCWS